MSSIPTQSSLLTHLPGFPVAVSDYVRLGFRSLYGCGAVRAFHPLPCIIRLNTCGLLRRRYVLIADTKGVLVGTLPPKLENRAVFRLRATYLPAFPVSQWLYRIISDWAFVLFTAAGQWRLFTSLPQRDSGVVQYSLSKESQGELAFVCRIWVGLGGRKISSLPPKFPNARKLQLSLLLMFQGGPLPA